MSDRPDEIARAALPPFLAEVAELASIGVALALARDFGGIRLYVPKQPGPGGKLARSVGLEAARALARAYGGEQLDVPRFAARKRLAIARAAGSSSQVARRFGVTQRWVRKVRNGGAGDGGQGRLFE
ncbi:MAG: hypothetical protein OEM93_08450 [Rhodospirillales bacterium]|nr:hypothetical protein [Rhodospirillales bacterium]MDH3920393.1 hypothetical protein [Rhodospirillales bacterium]MDH3969852.1 hypothetical protein [Rhodospirillales bacterium]